MKVGLIMMALALALVSAAAVVSATLRSESERLVAAEVAKKSPGQAPRYSSGEEGRATKKSSSEKESPRYPSGEESLEYGSSSGGPVGQQEEQAKEPQAVVQQEDETPNSQSAMPQLAGKQAPSEAPSVPEPQPQQHQPQLDEQPLPSSEQRGWPEPSQGELHSAKGERHYELLPGAIMGLTIEAIGIHDAPSSTPKASGR